MSPGSRRGRLKLRAARVVRPVLILLLAAVAVVIAFYLIRQIRQAPVPPPGKKDILASKVDRREKIRIFQTHREKGLIEASGDLNVPVDEKTYRLEGGVEIVDHGRKGGREIRMSGDVLTYDVEMTRFFLRGNVRIKYKDMTIVGTDFEYYQPEDLLKTESGAMVETPSLNGTARRVLFFFKDEEAVLEEDMRFSVRLRLPTPEPLVITGNKMAYGFLRRAGEAEGGLIIRHGLSSGTADRISLVKWEKTEDLKTLRLAGHVKMTLEEKKAGAGTPTAAPPSAAPEAAKSTIDREFRLGQSVRQEVESDDILLQAYEDRPQLNFVLCRGASAIKFLYPSGEATEFRGDSIDLTFNKKGGLTEIKSAGMSHIAGLDKAGSAGRVIEGASMTLDATAGVLRAASGPGRPARIGSAESDVSGGSLMILIKANDFEMKGNVQMSFRPAAAAEKDKGFFSTARPVFAKAGAMRNSSREKRFYLWDQVRAWQDQRILAAAEINLTEDMSEMTGQGGVLSVFPHKAKEGEPERRVEIAAGRMHVDKAALRLIYEVDCQLKSGAAVLQCGLITVDPGEGGGEILSVRAVKGKSKAVTIVMNDREGTGEAADYDVKDDTITLTGRPSLKEKDKGSVQGDKLTFHLADGTIRVESRDEKRPVPVIKS